MAKTLRQILDEVSIIGKAQKFVKRGFKTPKQTAEREAEGKKQLTIGLYMAQRGVKKEKERSSLGREARKSQRDYMRYKKFGATDIKQNQRQLRGNMTTANQSQKDKIAKNRYAQINKEENDEEQYGLLNEGDTLTLTVPLFIRMLEYAKEDAKTDMDLHKVTENLMALKGVADMDCYDKVVNEETLDELGIFQMKDYVKSASRNLIDLGNEEGKGREIQHKTGKYNLKKVDTNLRKQRNRKRGIDTAVDKLSGWK